ncbi:CGNR zinc finger domain-containing protein [Kutzneria sp. NPDC051319]|uniref:CGNR zinc finger domain-containing protein n=1 Tax=Kutzneria sp. NPDC051319 TaxID=3155047 RepID=UPI00341D97BD
MWPANGRYGMDVAPAGLGFVHDLLNTLPAGKPRVDLLASLDDAQPWLDGALAAWAGETGRERPEVSLTERDLDQVRGLREEIKTLLTGGEPAHELSSATLRLGSDGRVAVEPRGTGARLVASVVLIEMLAAQQADTWRRLKVCRNPRCQVAFFDRSRNNSGVWHATKTCGNVENLRAHRARAKSTA